MSAADRAGVGAAPGRGPLPSRSELAHHWDLDPGVVFLNHGSFGAVPRPVQEAGRGFQDRFNREPVRFIVEEMEPLLDESRRAVGAFLGGDSDDFAFMLNATMGVNTVIRSLTFERGDEVLTNNHEYNACQNVLRWAAERCGVKVVVVDVPFPVKSADEVHDAVMAAVTERTRLVMISHVTSATALIFPVERLVKALEWRGIDTLVDGAHAPGMLPLDIGAIGAAYYTGNLHKWVSAPSGAAFLHVRRDRQEGIRPVIVSHGANSGRQDRARFRLEFDYIGSMDYSAWLAVPEAIRFMGSLVPGGWAEVMRRNRDLALRARDAVCMRLGTARPAPDDMLGSMACVRLPDRSAAEEGRPTKYHDPLHDALIERHRVQAPIVPFPGPPRRYVRLSAALYNDIGEYEYLAGAIVEEIGRIGA